MRLLQLQFYFAFFFSFYNIEWPTQIQVIVHITAINLWYLLLLIRGSQNRSGLMCKLSIEIAICNAESYFRDSTKQLRFSWSFVKVFGNRLSQIFRSELHFNFGSISLKWSSSLDYYKYCSVKLNNISSFIWNCWLKV